MTKRWSSTASLDGQTKKQASKSARRAFKVGDYNADYDFPLDLDQPTPELDELYANSKHVK